MLDQPRNRIFWIIIQKPLQTNLTYTGRHTPGFHRTSLCYRITPFNPRITGNAFLAYSRQSPEHGLLIRTLLYTFSVTPASLLVNKDNSVFFSLVYSLPRT